MLFAETPRKETISPGAGLFTPDVWKSGEWHWVNGFALAVLLVTTIAYLVGYTFQTQANKFSGFVWDVKEGNAAIAIMMSGSSGDWFYHFPGDPTTYSGLPVYLPYLWLGKLAAGAGLHEQMVALYQIFRLIAGWLNILATYVFLSLFIKDIRLRRFGLALATLGGGLGWILMISGGGRPAGSFPLDYYSSATFGFLSILAVPHQALARACLFLGLSLYLRTEPVEAGWNRAGCLRGLKIGLLWLTAGILHPAEGIIFGIVLIAHLTGLVFWNAFLRATGQKPAWESALESALKRASIIILAGVLPAAWWVYNALMISQDPFARAYLSEISHLSPPPLHFLLAYGICLPFVWRGARDLLRRNPVDGLLLIGWGLLLPVLAYAPVNFQLDLVDGYWAVLIVLALAAGDITERFAARFNWQTAGRIVLYATFLSPLITLAFGISVATQRLEPVFLPAEKAIVYDVLTREASPGDLIMTAQETGDVLPAWAPVRVIADSIGENEVKKGAIPDSFGHGFRFFQSSPSEIDHLALILEYGIRFIFWGPVERANGNWDPRTAGYLMPIYQSGAYQIFEVIR